VGVDQGGVKVKDQPARGGGPGPPRPRSGGGASGPQARQSILAGLRELFDHPPGGRDRRHRPEQRLVPANKAQVAEAVATVGEHHDQVAQHPGWLVAAGPAAAWARELAQRPGESEPVGQLGQQPDPGVADQVLVGNNDLIARVGRLHPHPPGLADRPSTSRILPAQEGVAGIGGATSPRRQRPNSWRQGA
jgi:hypothetical protein